MESDAVLDPTPYSISSPRITAILPSEPDMYSSASPANSLWCCEYNVSITMEGYYHMENRRVQRRRLVCACDLRYLAASLSKRCSGNLSCSFNSPQSYRMSANRPSKQAPICFTPSSSICSKDTPRDLDNSATAAEAP